MIGRDLGQYRVLEKLGEGGMGEVYLAIDSSLGRRVALKVLSPDLAGEPGHLDRFAREARTLASLNHPNIVTVYAVEECQGVNFFAMELIDGLRLDEVIPEGGLSREKFFAVAVPLTDAIAAAHEGGVTHRDLKPANLMLSRHGQVKVLDFGLARSRVGVAREPEAAITDALTDENLLAGTVPYMSPEQVKGGHIDHRSDVFALGVVLYEMICGRRPFVAASAAELVAVILRDAPAPIDELRPAFSRRLVRLVGRCLEKEPRKRWQSVLDVHNELVEMSLGDDDRAGDVGSIAVVPFADMSPDKDQDYFCEGIAEELINALNRIRGLRVAPRSSSFHFRGSDLDVREVGGLLNVDTVLEGSVRKSGDRLRITAQLVDVAEGYGLWSERFDREMEDVFEIQEQIAASIVDALQVTLAPAEERRLRRSTTRVADAYDYYLRGRNYSYLYSRRGTESALDMFSRAIELDGTYALAWAGVADCRSFLYANQGKDAEQLEAALAAGERALALDSALAEAHVSLAVALGYNDQPAEAEAHFATAVKLDPRSFEASYFYARHCFTQGEAEAAIRLYERASTLRTDDYQALLLVAQNHDDLGRWAEAQDARRRGVRRVEERLKLRPDDTRALYMGANGLVALGEIERGLEWADRARQLDPDEPMLLYNLGCIYAMAGRVDDALDCLERSLPQGVAYRGWAKHDSNLDGLRSHPRFVALLASE